MKLKFKIMFESFPYYKDNLNSIFLVEDLIVFFSSFVVKLKIKINYKGWEVNYDMVENESFSWGKNCCTLLGKSAAIFCRRDRVVNASD